MSNPSKPIARSLLPLGPAVLVAALAAGCIHHRPIAAPVGMSLGPAGGVGAPPLATLVWVGHGTAERVTDGGWARVPAFDYEFTVEQRRWADHWESVKTLRRTHPDYDGSAGPRVQVYLFRVDLDVVGGDGVGYAVRSTLGNGRGQADREFRTAQLDLDARTGWFAPFDHYRITQHYQYEAGRLDELVELTDGGAPWVRNQEQAWLFGPAPLAGPPTVAPSSAPGVAVAGW